MLGMTMAVASTAADAAQTNHSWRLTDLLDQPVMDLQGNELGEIEDLVIRRSGRVKKAVISLGGPLGLNAETDVRFRALQIGPEGEVRLDATAEALANKPRFNYRRSDLFTGFYARPLPPAFGRGPRGGPARRYSPYPGQGSPDHYPFYPRSSPYFPHFYRPWHDLGGFHPMNRVYFPLLIMGSGMLDRPLLNKYGDEIGSVQDLIIGSDNRVANILISTGEFLGLGGKLVAIPYRPLGFSFYGVRYDITEEQLDSLPEYKE
jgi:sporulation protein YlmC with PRC-barrel domain